VGSHVNALVRSWGSVVAIAPERFIAKLMISRGYACDAIPALCASERRIPSEQQTTDYDAELADAVRRSDLDKLQKLYEGGRWYVVLVSHSTRPPFRLPTHTDDPTCSHRVWLQHDRLQSVFGIDPAHGVPAV